MRKHKPEQISGNIFIRPNYLEHIGDVVHGHKHNFDHTTFLFTGKAHVKAVLPNGSIVEKDFTAPSHFLVKKDVEHEITALEPDTEFFCVYSHRDAQGRVTEENDGWGNMNTNSYI